MGSMSPLHWLIVLAVVLVLFGGGSKISALMGDFAKGIKSFKKHMAEDESLDARPQTRSQIDSPIRPQDQPFNHSQGHVEPQGHADRAFRDRVMPPTQEDVSVSTPKSPVPDSDSPSR